jgi:hypothetical protein
MPVDKGVLKEPEKQPVSATTTPTAKRWQCHSATEMVITQGCGKQPPLLFGFSTYLCAVTACDARVCAARQQQLRSGRAASHSSRMQWRRPIVVAAVVYEGGVWAQLIQQQLEGAGLTQACCNMQQRVPAAAAAAQAVCSVWTHGRISGDYARTAGVMRSLLMQGIQCQADDQATLHTMMFHSLHPVIHNVTYPRP